jgi:ATP:ADP antiporter, AAA family
MYSYRINALRHWIATKSVAICRLYHKNAVQVIAGGPMNLKFPVASRRELGMLLLAGICFFSVLFSYYTVRPIREQFASELGGSAALPWLYLLVFCTMSALQPFYGKVVSHYSRRIFVPIIYTFFLLCLFGLQPFFELDLSAKFKGTAFYIWVSIFNLFVVAVFWSCMADVFRHEQAVRLYSVIALFGSLGAVAGPALAKVVVQSQGLPGLYRVASVALVLALVCLIWLFSTARAEQADHADKPLGGNLFAGALATWNNPLLLRLAILLLCVDGLSTILYTLLSDHGKTIAEPEARTAFFASIDWWTNSLTLFLQIAVTPFFLRVWGAGKAMAVPAFANCVMLLIFAISGEAGTIALTVIITRGFAYGLVNPARESLFTLVDREAKYKAKNFIDTVVWRFGDLVMVSFVALAIKLGASTPILAVCAAGFALTGSILSWPVLKIAAKVAPQEPAGDVSSR